MRPPFRVEWRDEEAFRTVWVFGDVDLSGVETLREALDCDQPRLEVDLSEVSFMDLSGLRCLIEAAQTCDVAIVASSPRADRLMELSDTAHHFVWE